MKITDIRWTPVRLHYKELEKASYGRRTGWINVIIEVDTDEGISGLGETYTASGVWVDAVLGSLESGSRILMGQDPCDIERLTELFYRFGNWRTLPRIGNLAFSGIEMACWDIAAKSLGVPLYRLFGGLLRDRIGFFGHLLRKSPSGMAEEARDLVAQDYRVLYFKVGLDQKDDLNVVAAVRDAVGPGIAIRVDANQAWDVGTAVQRIKEMQPYNLEFVEQPVKAEDWQALAKVRARVDVPIAANEGIWTAHDLTQVIRHEAADVVVMGTQWVGGLWALKKMASMAGLAGMRFCRHCVESMIGTAAALHVMATLDNLMDGNQFYVPMLENEVVRGTPLIVEEANIRVPDQPGIGVELDREKLARYAWRPGDDWMITYYTSFGGTEDDLAHTEQIKRRRTAGGQA